MTPSLRTVRSLSVAQAYDTIVSRALSLLADTGRVGVWEPAHQVVYWLDFSGRPLGIDTIPIQREELEPGFARPFEPYRLHARMKYRNGEMLLEIRPSIKDAPRHLIDASIVAIRRGSVDTLWQGQARSTAVKRGSIWLCCDQTQLFGEQIWWGQLRDGGLVAASSTAARLHRLNTEHEIEKVLTWRSRRAPVRSEVAIAYWEQGYKRLAADSSDNFHGRRSRDIRRRYSFFADFVADSTPAFSQLAVDQDDRMWVRRFDGAAWPDGLSELWDVLRPDGSYCAIARTPHLDYVFDVGVIGVLGSRRLEKGSHELVVLNPLSC